MWRVIGQDRAVNMIQRALETGMLTHAYLFVGPAHVGKMTLALNLAQALNCGSDQPPCGECSSCQRIASANHADVQVIGLSQNDGSPEAKLISIDQVREVQHSASLPPFEGKYRVYIIDGAESLSTEAANCLLKTLEEPVGKTVFILLTANDRLLPATVVSRCQRLELRPMSADGVESALKTMWGIEPERARLLARLSHGCPGWAISAAFDDSLVSVRGEEVDRAIDVIGADYEERFTYATKLAAQFAGDRRRVQGVLDLWLDLWRDLMLVKVDLKDIATNVDRLDTLAGMANGYSLDQIRDFIESIQAAGMQLALNANPRLVLEVMMLDIPKKEGGGEKKLAAYNIKNG